MKQKILLALGCLLMTSGAWATNYTLTLYADGCDSPNTFICPEGQQLSVSADVSREQKNKFSRWSDGNTDNPREITMNSDITLTAYYVPNVDGKCGEQLNWLYSQGLLTISGTGEMFDFSSSLVPWKWLRDSINSVVIEPGVISIGTYAFYRCSGLTSVTISNSVTDIGDYAFYGCYHLRMLTIGSSVAEIGDYAFAGCNDRKFTKIVFPQSVKTMGAHVCDGCEYLTSVKFGNDLEEIGDYAFSGCTRINDMTCYATVTPNVKSHTFDGVNRLAYVYVQAGSKRTYELDPYWGEFDIHEIGAESTTVTGNGVLVEPSDNEAVFTWPMSDGASTYSLAITKNGVVFCTLTFNAEGQLTNIAFAPARGEAANAPAATLTENGYQFTVTGLDYATNYAFSLNAKDATAQVVASYSGTFHTNGATALEDVQHDGVQIQKILRDGVLYILTPNGTFDATGRRVEE